MTSNTQIIKQVCECKNCGNEAEMEITCSLVEADSATDATGEKTDSHAHRVKGSATCSHCGNEADMWVDLPEQS